MTVPVDEGRVPYVVCLDLISDIIFTDKVWEGWL